MTIRSGLVLNGGSRIERSRSGFLHVGRAPSTPVDFVSSSKGSGAGEKSDIHTTEELELNPRIVADRRRTNRAGVHLLKPF